MKKQEKVEIKLEVFIILLSEMKFHIRRYMWISIILESFTYTYPWDVAEKIRCSTMLMEDVTY